METGPWWQSAVRPAGAAGASGAAADLVAERELWRVEAGRGMPSEAQESYGIFDLSFDWADGRWQLVGFLD